MFCDNSDNMENDNMEVPGDNLVLLCVDACETSERAVQWWLRYFRQPNHDLALVHVYPGPQMIQTGYMPEMYNDIYPDLLDEELRKSTEITDKFVEVCKKNGAEATVYNIANDNSIGETICNFAKKKQAICIVMGQRGLGIVKRTVFGSVSEYILHHAHIPVVIVPPPN